MGTAQENAPAAPEVDAAAAAAKKAAENKKKKERQKAKKAADAKSGNTGPVRWALGKLPGGRAERREAGNGRGLGVYACEPCGKDEVIASAAPALSVVFDGAATSCCSFCFATPAAGATTEQAVTLTTGGDGPAKSFGIKLDDLPPEAGAPPTTVIVAVTKDSSNRGAVRIGDRVVSVEGEAIVGGHAVAVPKLLEAAKKNEGRVKVVIARPALLTCQGCKKMAACASCVGAGRMAWHAYECKVFSSLPAGASQGESATVRMLLRFRLSTESSVGEWAEQKEPVSLLTSLQANVCDVPPEQLASLSRYTGVSSVNVASIVYQVRTNACEIVRNGKKAGCALSVLMGWHNHSCMPNAKAEVRDDGQVALSALRDLAEGEEVLISYIDATKDYEERRKTLALHYGFDCKCERCVVEQRKELKQRMAHADAYRKEQRGLR